MRALALLLLLTSGCVRAGWRPGDAAAALDGSDGAPVDDDGAGTPDGDGAPDGPAGPAYYISPTGDDSNPGTRAAPWRSWSTAISRLVPGDTLVALDGTYADTAANRLFIDCDPASTTCDGAPCPSGTAQAPITLRAERERMAHIPSGEYASLRIDACRHWVIEGLHLSQSDTGTNGELQLVRLLDDDHVTLRRLLLEKPNRSRNSHGLLASDCTFLLVEECEVYDFHRYGMLINRGSDIVLRRNYINSRDRADLAGGYASNDPTTGDSGIQLNATQRVTAENNLVERARMGIKVETGGYPDTVVGGGDDNRLLGNVVRAATTFAYSFDSNCLSQTPCDSSLNTVSNLEVRDCVAVGSAYNGFTGNGVEDAALTNLTSADAAHNDYHFTLATENSGMQSSVTLQSCLNFGAGGANGFLLESQASWSVDHCNSYGNTYNYDSMTNVTSSTDIDPQMGGCYLYVPAGSPMKGAGKGGGDIGASVVLAYENGAQTSRRLWDQTSGVFVGCGATVTGVNDATTQSCVTVHQRLHVGSGGCAIP